jgi:hypothetical protein
VAPVPRLARDLVRFPGSGGVENDTARQWKDSFGYTINDPLNDLSTGPDPSDEEVFLDRQPLWFKLAAAAALLYAAYLVGRSAAEPAEQKEAPRTPNHEIAVMAPSQIPLVSAVAVEVAPATDKPVPETQPPPGERALNNEELLEVQARLKGLGHDPGPVDGIHGPQTVSAVKRYEIANHLEPTGAIDLRLLERLRR